MSGEKQFQMQSSEKSRELQKKHAQYEQVGDLEIRLMNEKSMTDEQRRLQADKYRKRVMPQTELSEAAD